jgi:hypothetical protein
VTSLKGDSGAALALAVDDVVAFAIAFDHAVDCGEGILQVGIDEHDGVA